MTFCLAIKCEDGLIAISDTRITSGSEVSAANKILVYEGERQSIFILTSGLRSVRDKAITYFDERWRRGTDDLTRTYHAANALAYEMRRVYEEDNQWLMRANLTFDLHCIVGGQLSEDDQPRLFLVYPQGNWVEVPSETPYVIIGDARYGKPTLDRILSYDVPLERALRVGLISFDSTQASSADVGPPIDIAIQRQHSFHTPVRRFDAKDLEPLHHYWQHSISAAIDGAEDPVASVAEALGIANTGRAPE